MLSWHQTLHLHRPLTVVKDHQPVSTDILLNLLPRSLAHQESLHFFEKWPLQVLSEAIQSCCHLSFFQACSLEYTLPTLMPNIFLTFLSL